MYCTYFLIISYETVHEVYYFAYVWIAEPKTCTIDKDELVDGLRVLVFKDGLFYEGAVKGIRPPDVYGVVIDNARGNRPYIYSQEEILKEAVRSLLISVLSFVQFKLQIFLLGLFIISKFCLFSKNILKSLILQIIHISKSTTHGVIIYIRGGGAYFCWLSSFWFIVT